MSITADPNKQILIEKILDYWNFTFKEKEFTTTTIEDVENFPINKMSRTFSEWFFGILNTCEIKSDDFYVDVNCTVQLMENNIVIKEESVDNAQLTLQLLSSIQFYFNPNLCHDGVQGRMDPHGLALVLSCGTLHKLENKQCMGCFECAFGLMRDPFTDNNWKIKYMKLRLQSSQIKSLPTLQQCDSLQIMYALPDTSQEMDLA